MACLTGSEPGSSTSRVMMVDKAEYIHYICEKKCVSIITVDDAEYPQRIKKIPEMPMLFYVEGQLRLNEFMSSVGIAETGCHSFRISS